METQEQTSLKELFQGMIPESTTVLRGRVTQAAPLKIQVLGDDKLILHENIICLPRHLSDYTTKIDIQLNNGSIDSVTRNDGAHTHGPNGGHSQFSGDGVHAHPASGETTHVHAQATFNIFGATIKVYNALKVGELVYILSFNQGKKYYILDREVQ
jgi:hypothetical protein